MVYKNMNYEDNYNDMSYKNINYKNINRYAVQIKVLFFYR